MDLANMLRWTARRCPRRRAVGGDLPMNYAQWDEHTDRLAKALASLGVRKGDRVAMLLTGGEPLASAHLALQKLGAVSVPLSVRFSAEEVDFCLKDCEPRLVLADAEQAPRLPPTDIRRAYVGDPEAGGTSLDALSREMTSHAIPENVADTDQSVLLYTAGTTGKPKGVPRTHAAEHAAAVAHALQTGLAPGEVSLGVMPMFHTMGIRTLLVSVLLGGTWVPQVRFAAEETFRLMDKERITSLYLVPTLYSSLLRSGVLAEADSVRKLAYAGAPMPPSTVGQLVEVLHPDVLVNHYGSTEIFTFAFGTEVTHKPGYAGRAGIFGTLRLVDPHPGASPHDLVEVGEQGQVAVSMSSPEAFAGYWRRPEADAKAIRDGWYFPGDLGTIDADGDLWVSGRVDDMINSGGENLYPEEIEETLRASGIIEDVVVVGLPDEHWGHAVTAFVIPAHSADVTRTLRQLADYVNGSSLARLKHPKRYVAIERIPASAVGKILRRELVAGHFEALAHYTPGERA